MRGNGTIWKWEYFKELLGGIEERVIIGTYNGLRENGEELLGREEI